MDKSQTLTILAVVNPEIRELRIAKQTTSVTECKRKKHKHKRLLLLTSGNGTEHHEHSNRNLNKLIECHKSLLLATLSSSQLVITNKQDSVIL
ncbi:unnamed protein product [Macrosiphum euphorbiae]|uniref:Uncharacterized protein n=1 Tax=Macrosiphum euphorbiae TaxID=13131 RepID=A0AAV0W2N3_9HEMI|nr:unnamed protein product [Macrosiphum euphorbiae]